MAFTKVRGRGVTTTDNYTVGVITATKFVGPITGGGGGIQVGLLTATGLDINGDADISGNLTVGGDFTTLNTTLREVELLHVDANSDATAGIITQRGSGDILNLFDTTTEVMTVVNGGFVGIGITNPGVALEIKGTAATLLRLDSSNAQGTSFRIRNSGTDKMYMGLAADFITGASGNVTDSAIRASGALLLAAGGGSERLRIDANGLIANNARTPSNYGSPNLLISGTDSTLTLMGDGSTNNTSFTGIKFRVAGGSHGDYTKAGIFSRREGGYNDLSLIFALDTVADATSVSIADEKMRITSAGAVGINSATPTANYKLDVNGDLTLGEIAGTDNTYIDQKQDGDLHIINSGRTANGGADPGGAGGVGINRYNNIGGGTSLFRDFVVYNGKNARILTVDGSASSVGIGTHVPAFPSGKGLEIHDTLNPRLKLTNAATGVGSGDGTQLYLATTGDTILENKDSKDILFYAGTNEKIRIKSNGRLGIGTNAPLGIAHINVGGGSTEPFVIERSGSGESIWSMKPYSGNLYFRGGPAVGNYSSDRFAILYGGDNARGGDVAFFGTAAGITSCLWDASANKLIFKDNSKLVLGDGEDFTMYHDGSGNTILQDDNNFYIKGNSVYIQSNQSEPSAYFSYNGAVKLFYDGGTYSTPKLQTTATGITVDGEVASSQDYPNYRPRIDWNFAKTKKLDPRITFSRLGPASYVDKNGYVKLVDENEPRFDHDPLTGECKGLLMEQNVVNWIKWSSKLDVDGQWGQNNTTNVLAPDVVGPDGKTGNVYEVFEDATSAYHATHYSSSIPVNNGTKYTVSSWIKKGPNYRTDINGGKFQFYCSRGTGTVAYVSIDPTFTSITNHSNTDTRSITQYRNGWVRVTYTFTSNSTTGSVTPHWLHGNGGSYMGNGASSVYIWGCQFESMPFPTSYIPSAGDYNYRNDDIAVIDGTEFSEFFNPDEGTSVVHAHMPNSNGNSGLPSYTFKNSAVSAVTLGLSRDNGSDPAYHYYHDGTNSGFTRASANNQNMYKGAMSFKTSDFDSYVNGSANTNTTTFTMPTIDNLRIGGTGGANQIGGHIARFMYYPVKLPNSQLITLTS